VEQDGRPAVGGDGSTPPVEPVSWQVVEPAAPIAGESLAATIAALADPETRSPVPDTCPFLRAIDHAGGVAPPVEAADPANRCVAVGAPTPQSNRQQQLVCLTAAHNNCPRYLRGSLVAEDSLVVPRDNRGLSTPVIASALLLVAATAMSVGFLLVRGSFDLPAAAAGPTQVAVAPSLTSAAPSPIATTASQPSYAPTDGPAASVRPTTAPPATATPSPAPTPASTPAPATPRPTPTPAPTSDRYLLLVPCPNAADCWIYTVRAGDNLRSIVNYFGVSYDEVLAMNPRITDPTNIHAGDDIRMPPPTR
jgi:hypothetical protein